MIGNNYNYCSDEQITNTCTITLINQTNQISAKSNNATRLYIQKSPTNRQKFKSLTYVDK